MPRADALIDQPVKTSRRRDTGSPISKPVKTPPRSNGKHPGGRPSDYNPKYDNMAYELARFGATNDELASAFSTSTVAMDRWVRYHTGFRESLNRGKDEYDSGKIKKSLRDRALGYTFDEKTVETVEIECERVDKGGAVLRDDRGKVMKVKVPAVKTKITSKHIPAEPVCIFFWLTNRQRKDWQHIRINQVSGKLDGPQPITNNYYDFTEVGKEELESLRDSLNKAIKQRDRRTTGDDTGQPSGTA